MLSKQELTRIDALDLAPEVNEAIKSLDEQHRDMLFADDSQTGAQDDSPPPFADHGDEIKEDLNSNRGSRFLKGKEKLIPWHVQFS